MDKYLKHADFHITEKLLDVLIAAEWYHHDTKPTWVQYQLINLFKDTPSDFPIHLSDNTWAGEITYDLYTEIKKQYHDLNDKFGAQDYHIRYELCDKDLFRKICKFDDLKILQTLGASISMQSMTSHGNGLFPHTDLYRKSTLFYLLEGNDHETIWYDYPVDPHKECEKYGFQWNLPDPDLLVEDFRIQIQPKTWYLFDNASYHRVQPVKSDPATRKSLSIQFNQPLSVIAEKLASNNIS
jgi:hypothetical protein